MNHSDALRAIVAAKHCGQHTWREIGAFVGWGRARTRAKYLHRDEDRHPPGSMPEPCPICSGSPTADREGPSVSFTERGNQAEATSTSERIKTLDQLLSAAEVDLETWQVRDWGVKKWEVGAKIKTGHLEWDDGRIDGHLDYHGLGVQDLWSVWAKFLRREPVAIYPIIQPVECPVTFRKPGRPRDGNVNRALIGADSQLGYCLGNVGGRLEPFHDRLAIDAFLQLAAYLQCGTVIILGDFLDWTEWTDRFLRSPEFMRLTQPALLEGHWVLRQLRESCPDSRIELHEGNHDKRPRDYLTTHLQTAYGLKAVDELELPPALSPEKLLALHRLGIEWVGDYPDDLSWLNDGLRLFHGDRASTVPGATARAILEDANESVIYAHAHRREKASRTMRGNGKIRTIEAHGIGCLCRIDGAVPAKKQRVNWQQGMAIVDYTESAHSIYDVEIRDGSAIWDGRVFQGRDYRDSLQQDYKGWNW